jgi:hypothetical protein
LLTRAGLSEAEAAAFLDRLGAEFAAGHLEDQEARLEFIESELAEVRRSQRISPGRLENVITTLATSFLYDVLKSRFKSGPAEPTASASGKAEPSATAKVPPKEMSPEGQFHWPIDDPTATMQFIPTPTGILLTCLGPGGSVRAAANGTIKVVEHGSGRIFWRAPSFLIGIDHANDFLTFYAGFGVLSSSYRHQGVRYIRQGVPVGAERQIAGIWHRHKLGPLPLYFQMSWRGRYIDPRSHLPSFPGSIGPDLTQAAPAVQELIQISREYDARVAGRPSHS